MKSKVKFLFFALLLLSTVSCAEADSVENEVELFSTDGETTSPEDGKD